MRLVLVLLLAAPALAQAPSATVSGTVRDASGAPLAGASVYLSGTTRGDAADAEGRYEIAGVPPGAYRIVGSLLGYAARAEAITLAPAEQRSLDLLLEETTAALAGVTVEARRDERWARDLAWFTKALLGESANADSTRLLNPEALSFRRSWGTLYAEAAAPLVIENRALGYRITYDLTAFDASSGHVRYDGDERFESLAPADSAEAARWEAARLRAWRGSLMHLLQSLLAGRAEAEGYSFLAVHEDPYGARPTFRTSASRVMEVGPDGWGTLRLPDRLDVAYSGEPEEARYLTSEWFREPRRRPDAVQRSSLMLDGPLARIDPQGTPENPFALSASGHMAFERLADRVPEDFRAGRSF